MNHCDYIHCKNRPVWLQIDFVTNRYFVLKNNFSGVFSNKEVAEDPYITPEK